MSENQEKVQEEQVVEQTTEVKPADDTNKVQNEEEKKNQIIEKYVARKNFKNKVGALVGLCVCFVVALAVIIVSCLQFSVMPKFLTDQQVDRFEITLDSSSSVPYSRGTDDFEKLEKEYQKAFSMSLMTALFSGQTGGYYVKEEGRFYETDMTKNLGSSNYVKVQFAEEQTLLSSDGSIYKSYTRPEAEKVTFNTVYIPLQTENGFNEVNILIPVYGIYYTGDATIPTFVTIKRSVNLYGFTQGIENILEK